jgi:hypothetical protein
VSRGVRRMKYNPAFLAEEELRAGFVVRNMELAYVLESLRENTSGASQHVLVIGPRGAGKSTLVQRVAGELRSDPQLARSYFPVRFGEESYEVDSAGALWLEALLHLGQQTEERRWQVAYEQLRRERDRERLRQLALAELHAFREASGQRLVLIVENLHLLLSEQISADEAWTIRHTLLNDPDIVLLTTATSRFAAIDAPDQAMYELFRVIVLDPLVAAECAVVWRHLTGQSADERQGRALEILTGGNLRLLAVLANFGSDAPLPAVLDNLHELIDDHTEFFKSNIEAIPPGERRVFAGLADHWAPATASELAELLRADVNLVSAQLARLEQRGVVSSSGTPRRKRYQLVERLYNIYYLLRRHGGASERVQVVVDFIAAYYAPDALVERLIGFAAQSLRAPGEQRALYINAFVSLYRKIADTHGPAIRERLPAGFLELPEVDPALRDSFAAQQRAQEALTAALMGPFRAWFDGSIVVDAIRGALQGAPGLTSLLAALKGEPPVAEEAFADLEEELARVRVAIRACCEGALARDDVSHADLGCVALLASLWVRDVPLVRAVMDRLLGSLRDHPYVRLIELHLVQSIAAAPPEVFAEGVQRLVAEHPEQLALPFAAALLCLGHGARQPAGTLFRGAVFWTRLVPLADALVEIFNDLRDEETDIVLEPRLAWLVPLLEPKRWTPAFTLLAKLAELAAGRPEDAVAVLTRGLKVGETSFVLRAQLAWLQRQRLGLFQEGEDTLRAVGMKVDEDWISQALHGVLLLEPQRDITAAIPVLTRSWQRFSAGLKAPFPRETRVIFWLFPALFLLTRHRIPRVFVSALRRSPEQAWADLEALTGDTPTMSAVLERAVISIAMRGDARRLLTWLTVPERPPVMGLVAHALASYLGEQSLAPREIEKIAEDVAFDLAWTRALYQIVSDEVVVREDVRAAPTGPSARSKRRPKWRR